ncbi:hypothetical protein [Raoultella ornithinolytica]|uniref:hypothetical protein n=1 Tax=Raoultella ornithinolytica TaxID=54291 RepID=UPI0015B9AD9B|nr:hypothetical protein [Raoultella ornithinolytica]
MGEISVKTGNNARNGGKNSLNRLIRCVCGKKIGPDPRNFNQRVSLGRNDLLIRTFPSYFIGFFSIWNAFIIPIILGIGISYLFQFQGDINTIPRYYIAFYVLIFIIHILISFAFLYLDKREDTSSHLESTIVKYNELANNFNNLTSRSFNQIELHQTQKAVIHFTTLLIKDKLSVMAEKSQAKDLTTENVTNDVGTFFDTVLGFLSSKREVLFGYKGESKFNIALYLYDSTREGANKFLI